MSYSPYKKRGAKRPPPVSERVKLLVGEGGTLWQQQGGSKEIGGNFLGEVNGGPLSY